MTKNNYDMTSLHDMTRTPGIRHVIDPERLINLDEGDLDSEMFRWPSEEKGGGFQWVAMVAQDLWTVLTGSLVRLRERLSI